MPTCSTPGRRTRLVRGPFNDFGDAPSPVDREALAKGPFRNERNGELIVERLEDGPPVGSSAGTSSRYGPNVGSGAWNIGISLIPIARGHGYGAEAQRLVADYLFATTPVDRVEASTDVENAGRAALPREGRVHPRGPAARARSNAPAAGTTWSTTRGCERDP